MYNYGGCPTSQAPYYYPIYNNSNSNYAVILVLFILLVIVIGTRWNNN